LPWFIRNTYFVHPWIRETHFLHQLLLEGILWVSVVSWSLSYRVVKTHRMPYFCKKLHPWVRDTCCLHPLLVTHTLAQGGSYSANRCVAVCCSVLQCVAVCCSVLQCAAVCCNVSQCVAAWLFQRTSATNDRAHL